jgi:hypothetical protein
MTIVAREDLMAFLKAKNIRRIRIGEAVYYSLTQSEKAWRKRLTTSRRKESVRRES